MQYWDKLVRMTHWCVALGFLINRAGITYPGSDWHQWIGFAVVACVLLRLIWGLTFASGPARLSALIPTLPAILDHIQEIKTRTAHKKLAHNPVGMLFIWTAWIVLLLIGFTGWAQDTDLIDRWPVEIWHSWLVTGLTVLICIHISAVILLSIWLKHDLLRAMLPARKKR